MVGILFDSELTDEARRERLYKGDLFVYSPCEATQELCKLARDLAEEAFHPFHPEHAQHELPVEQYAGILAELKPRFIHHERCKTLIPEILRRHGADPERTYFDVPRLRTSTSDGYLTTGIAYAFHPHRDTWYSAPQCQINWWLPVYPVTPENGMTFHPNYFNSVAENSSEVYNYYRWNKESRASAAKHIGRDTREQPKPTGELDLEHDIRITTPVGGVCVFAAAHLHSSTPNFSGRTRFSIDFRTVHADDVANFRGAPNVDSKCTGTSLRDFLCGTDLSRLPEELVAPYDTEPPDEEAELVYKPGPSS